MPPYARAATFLGILLLAGIVLAAVVSVVGVLRVDVAIAQELQETRPIDVVLLPIMVSVSALGYDPWTEILLGAAILWALLWRQWVAAALIAATLVADGLAALVKLVVARPRPTSDLVEVYRVVSGYSFPSGHVVHYVAFFGIIGYLAWRRLGASPSLPAGVRVLLQVLLGLCSALVVLVGPSRVYLGAHWPTDVLGGYLLGGACLVVLIVIGEHTRAQMQSPARQPA